jgi:hypothetical protein
MKKPTPNQSLEPMAMAVTIRASSFAEPTEDRNAQLRPSIVVAHFNGEECIICSYTY